ncbi:MAG: MerR family transcriptional regulator [Nitriliruptoraceae bacterium]
MSSSTPPKDTGNAELQRAVSLDDDAVYDLASLAELVGTTPTLLQALERTGLLLAYQHDADGTAHYSDADAQAVRAGLTLLDAGLPLAELLNLAQHTDAAIKDIAVHAVDAFIAFVRDPVHGTSTSPSEAVTRLVTAYEQMLPATETLVAHHLRRRLIGEALERLSASES